MNIKTLLCICLALLLSACVTVESNAPQARLITMVSSGDLNFIPANSKSFAWHPVLANVVPHPNINHQQLADHIRVALVQVMADKGYHLVDINSGPDMILGFGLTLGSDMSDAEILQKAGLVAGLSSQGVDSSHYEKGSLLLALFAPRATPVTSQLSSQISSQRSWRILAQGFSDLDKNDVERQLKFEQLMVTMLRSVPISQASGIR